MNMMMGDRKHFMRALEHQAFDYDDDDDDDDDDGSYSK